MTKTYIVSFIADTEEHLDKTKKYNKDEFIWNERF